MFAGELKSEVKQVKGIGSAAADSLKNLAVHTTGELLLFFPRAYEDRSNIVPLRTAVQNPSGAVTTVVEVVAHDYFRWGPKQVLKVHVRDESGTGVLVCFGRNFLKNKLIPGSRFFLSGRFEFKYGELQCSSFEVEPYSDHPSLFGKILPVYPLTGNLTQAQMRKALHSLLQNQGKYLEPELPAGLTEKRNLLTTSEALYNIHFPVSMDMLRKASETLIFNELFYLQIVIGKIKRSKKTAHRRPRSFSGELSRRLTESLPFRLTADQIHVLEEIHTDLSSEKPMARLLQGDVGCGKTLVAFLSALSFMEEKMQAVLMAPTELLAQQHAENAYSLMKPLGVEVAFLSGSVTGEKRKTLLSQIKKGAVDFIIGTHALFSEDVHFHNLQYIIIDEQHRFGVLQRQALIGKADAPDVLFMTATPIPRTLAITIFGDLDISSITSMPANRKPVITHLAKIGNEKKVYDWVMEELKNGRQAYFVYPLIEESEKLTLKDAENMFAYLQREIFKGYTCGLIHSRVREDEKYAAMSAFQKNEIQVLAATSVVEVGVDVPNATCMVVEHADRFGLAALHQLRGRVGRGEHQSYTFLIFSENLTEDGKARLKVMKEHSDGFYIAEEDLKLRGAGNIAGTRQSGYFQLNIADPIAHLDVMLEAKKEADEILEKDPGLLEPENRLIGEVLHRAPPFPPETAHQG